MRYLLYELNTDTETWQMMADNLLNDEEKNDVLFIGSERWKIMKEFNPTKEDYIIDSKTRYDAFMVQNSWHILNLCCKNTARTAFDHDFEVLFLKDGTAVNTIETHQASLLNLSHEYATTIIEVDQVLLKALKKQLKV